MSTTVDRYEHMVNNSNELAELRNHVQELNDARIRLVKERDSMERERDDYRTVLEGIDSNSLYGDAILSRTRKDARDVLLKYPHNNLENE